MSHSQVILRELRLTALFPKQAEEAAIKCQFSLKVSRTSPKKIVAQGEHTSSQQATST